MDLVDVPWRQLERRVAVPVGKTFKPVRKTEYSFHAVMEEQAHYQGSDDFIESRADAAAGDDSALQLRRIEVDFLSRSGQFHARGLLPFGKAGPDFR